MKKLFITFLCLSIHLPICTFSQIVFTKTFGKGVGHCVQQTDDGYIITGETDNGNGGTDAFLLKTNYFGTAVWQRIWGNGGEFDFDYGNVVQYTFDGGYIVGGMVSAVGIIKTDFEGNTLWKKNWSCNSLQQTSDNGYIILGDKLVKTNESGDSLWTRPYSGNSVRQTIDSGFIIVGKVLGDVSLIKTDSKGDTLWTRHYGDANKIESGKSIQQTMDSGYVVVGSQSADSSGNNSSVYLIKTNSHGDTLWTKRYECNDCLGNAVQQTMDNGYVIVGGKTHLYLLKTDAHGDTLWSRTLKASAGYSVQQTIDTGFIITGTTGDVYLTKTDNKGNVTGIAENSALNNHLSVNVYPNPSHGKFTITMEGARENGSASLTTMIVICNVFGEKVYSAIQTQQSSIINLSKLPAGIYFLQVNTGEEIVNRKLVLEK